jgi:aerobic-type carbon monoxide dehydrogenase small subunit (CoxS/CutS family)
VSFCLRVDGRELTVEGEGRSLLEVLREDYGIRSAKDGCSPQGQCGCCTVLVDGSPRVACVTPARRVAGRSVTTLEGMDPGVRDRWAEALCAVGGSQCGFCTPGIIVRLAALGERAGDEGAVARALAAHLCRCTGWQTVVEAATRVAAGGSGAGAGASARALPVRDLVAASRRAALEGATWQRVGPDVALGRAGFADDVAPPDALVAVPDGRGGWAVGETLAAARAAAGRIPGRRSGVALRYPLEVPAGEWDLTLRTTWVEPSYLEPDASWCAPGGEPASPLANGGAFGGKGASLAPAAARSLADRYGRPVRVVLSREDVVRLGPKRPPMAAGVRRDGTGQLRVVATPGWADAVRSVAPDLEVEECDIPGPPTSAALRRAGWVEAAVLLAAVVSEGRPQATIRREAAEATAQIGSDGAVRVRVRCGLPLDEVVLRSYCIGATHMALGWVTSEGIAVGDDGEPTDLTIRSFGILPARQMPAVDVEIVADPGPPVNGSDLVFAAVAAAKWIEQGLPPEWPTRKGTTP